MIFTSNGDASCSLLTYIHSLPLQHFFQPSREDSRPPKAEEISHLRSHPKKGTVRLRYGSSTSAEEDLLLDTFDFLEGFVFYGFIEKGRRRQRICKY